MDSLFNKIVETVRQNKACVSATIVSSRGSSPRKVGAKMLVFSGGKIEGTIGGGALEKLVVGDALAALKRKKSFLKVYHLDKRSGLQVCGGRVDIFFEVVAASKQLVICGGGHIGLALSYIGALLGFSVVIVDNRKDFANKARFPHAQNVVCAAYARAIKGLDIDSQTSIVIVTHGHKHDEECLASALKTSAGYVGMIGSRAKIKNVFMSLRKKGFQDVKLKQVHAPIGLDIGAQTPEEIAVAIAGELIKSGAM